MVKIIMPTLDESKWVHFGNGPGMQAKLDRLADKHISLAKAEYLRQAKHPNTTSPYYLSSFRKVRARVARYEARRVDNTDPTWKWIEFGAHAGGKTPILKYRPMSRAMDQLKAEAGNA